MSKKIMILGASILQLPAIKKAKEMGLDVIAVDMNPDAVGFKEEGIKKEIISTIDIPRVLEAAKKNRINGIMTLASDMPMRTVAAVANHLNLVGISESTALRATNKFEMRKALKEFGVPVPLFFRIGNECEAEQIAKIFSGRFISKPADNSGSRGIFLVDNISMVKEAYNYSKSYSRNGDVVFEEYMEGPEVSVETLTIDGECNVIQITDKITTGAPFFVEVGHSQPSRLEANVKERIKNIAIDANKAIGIKNGPSHTEIIVTKDGPKIVEIGARLGGDCITTHLVPLSTGIDMVESCIQISLGEKPNLIKKWNKGAAIMYFSTQTGVIKEIKGLEQVKKMTGIVQVSIVHGVGESVGQIKSSSDRVGFVVAQGDDAFEALKNAKSGIDKVDFLFK